MTNMRRVTIPIPDELDEKLLELKKTDEFVRCSYAEIVRILVRKALDLEPKQAG